MAESKHEKNKSPSFRFIHESAEEAPVGLQCPRCNQSHQIVMSRLQERRGPVQRLMFYYFRCGVCDCRFRHPTAGGVVTFLFCGLAVIVFPVAATFLSLLL